MCFRTDATCARPAISRFVAESALAQLTYAVSDTLLSMTIQLSGGKLTTTSGRNWRPLSSVVECCNVNSRPSQNPALVRSDSRIISPHSPCTLLLPRNACDNSLASRPIVSFSRRNSSIFSLRANRSWASRLYFSSTERLKLLRLSRSGFSISSIWRDDSSRRVERESLSMSFARLRNRSSSMRARSAVSDCILARSACAAASCCVTVALSTLADESDEFSLMDVSSNTRHSIDRVTIAIVIIFKNQLTGAH